jgi:NAD(P)H-hydrate epimerase
MTYITIKENILKRVYARRPPWSRKGDFGRVLVLGGSYYYTGSPALVALAALRTGSDFVKILAPKRAADACAAFSPELVSVPLPSDTFSRESLPEAEEQAEWATVVTLGNGIGVGERQTEFINSLLKTMKKPIVVDADALKVLDKSLLHRKLLLTPNSHEFKVLFGREPGADISERISLVKEKAREFDTNILLKGHVDVISDGEEVYVNKINSVYMTKAGTGDVLTGICAAVAGMKNNLILSASAGAVINGYTGRSISKTLKESLSPMDIINNVHSTITKWRIY